MASPYADSKAAAPPFPVAKGGPGRMWWVATGLLVAMAALVAASIPLAARWPAFLYVRAFAQSACVGACADWFAVVALFRRPFGLPIPHTAVIPRHKARLGQALARFVCVHFLAPEEVGRRLETLDLVGRLAAWCRDPAHAARTARRLARLAAALGGAVRDGPLTPLIRATMRRGLAGIEAAPLAARVLGVLVARDWHQRAFDALLDLAQETLAGNREAIRAAVSRRSGRWVPDWIDTRLAGIIMTGLEGTLSDLHGRDHPWRRALLAALDRGIARLATDPAAIARGEAVKQAILADPEVSAHLDALWTGWAGRLLADGDGDGVLRQGMQRLLISLGRRLETDGRLRDGVERWLRRVAEGWVAPARGGIGDFIASVVERWDTPTLVARIEGAVGRDLQYIRVNGTVVGGLIGLVLYAALRAFGVSI